MALHSIQQATAGSVFFTKLYEREFFDSKKEYRFPKAKRISIFRINTSKSSTILLSELISWRMSTVDPAQIQTWIQSSSAAVSKSTNNSRKQPGTLNNLPFAFSDVSVPIVVQHNVTVNSEDKFPEKLWYLVDRPAFNDVIHWSPDGTAIVMYDELFVLKILKRQHDKIFKTESLKSFVRQLNLYGFRKVQSDRESMGNDLEVVSLYEHEYFVRGRPELLKHVCRRKQVKAKKQQPAGTILNFPQTLHTGERQAKRRLTFSRQKENQNVSLQQELAHTEFPNGMQRLRNVPLTSFRECVPATHLQESIGHFMPMYRDPNLQLLFTTGHMLAAPQLSSNPLIPNSHMLTGNLLPSALPMMSTNDIASKFPDLSSHSMPTRGMALTPSTCQSFPTAGEETPSAIGLPSTPVGKGSPAPVTESTATNAPGSFLNTPTSLHWPPMSNVPSAEAQSHLPHPYVNLSPLSLLCANMFSPFNDDQRLHKATQTPPQSTQAALSLLADQASKKPKSPETNILEA